MSETTEKSNKNLQDSLLSDLQSSDETKIISALDKIKEKGNVAMITPMMDVFEDTDNELIKEMIRTIFSELKVSTALVPLVEGLQRNNDELNEVILFSLWHANFNPILFIEEIVSVCCEGSYMTALEGLTLIENLEGPFNEEVLLAAKNVLTEYFQEVDKVEGKEDLMQSMQEQIDGFFNFLVA
jgi:hypothetical protein